MYNSESQLSEVPYKWKFSRDLFQERRLIREMKYWSPVAIREIKICEIKNESLFVKHCIFHERALIFNPQKITTYTVAQSCI